MHIGIVGLPNVGKSTLFNALTQKSVPAENYPFCTIDPSVGIVAVPDERLDALAKLSGSAKKIPAAVEFVDIAGLVKGAAEGEGLGNKFLSNIREVDAIAHVVRVFEDSEVHHVEGSIDPMRDISVINTELILADLETIEKSLDKARAKARTGEKDALAEVEAMEKIYGALKEEKFASEVPLRKEEKDLVSGLHLLTDKKVLYVLNTKLEDGDFSEETKKKIAELKGFLEDGNFKYVVLDASVELEVSSLSAEEKSEMRAMFDVDNTGVDGLIRAGYELLDLISFFTTGEKESRAWTVRQGSTAPEAGAAIHSDFRDKFIRADVIYWEKLLEAGSWGAAREKGWVRTEGKEYVVEDGDVVEFKI